jgi:hypothetical protein
VEFEQVWPNELGLGSATEIPATSGVEKNWISKQWVEILSALGL